MNQENTGGELRLRELFNVLQRYKWFLLGVPLVSGVLAASYVSFVLRPTWEASAVLDVGHVGQVVQAGQTWQVGQVLVEPVANVVTRMMLPSFIKGALACLSIKSYELEAVQGFYSTLKVSQVKGVELIEIKLRGPSAEMAKNLLSGAIVSLQKAHSEMMAVSIETTKKQLQIQLEDIKAVSDEVDVLKKKLLSSHDWSAFDATLFATVLQNKSTQLRDMVQKKIALEEQLTPSRTYTTRVVDDIYVSEGPVSPNKALIIELAILLGLFGALVVAFAHNAITTIRHDI